MKLDVLKGTTSFIAYIFIRNSSLTTGAGLTGLVYNTSGLTAHYVRPGAAATAVTLATQTVTGAYSSGGFVEVSSANVPGVYRLDIPNAVFASGVNSTVLMLHGAANMEPVVMEFQLVSYNPNDAVRLGLTSLPNAAAAAAGGVPVIGTGANQFKSDASANVTFANTSIATVTNLTNLPSIPAGWLTAAGIAADALSAAKLATDAVNKIRDAILSDGTSFPGANIAELGAANLPADIDSLLARLTATRAGYLDELGAANIPADLDALIARLTAARAGYLDNLNVGGAVASSAEATAIQNNTRVVRVVPAVIERPDSGSDTFRIELLLYDSMGNMEAPDAAPTVGVVDESGNSRDVNLDATTMTLVSTGRYRSTYTVASTHDLEQLIFSFSVVEGGNTRVYANASIVVDTTAVDFTATDRAKLDELHDNRLTATRAGYLDELAAANLPADVDTLLARLSAARAGYLDELAAANIPADLDTLIARLTATRASNLDGLTAARTGYLDELAAANIPADLDTLIARLTAVRAGYLDELATANIPTDIDTLIARLTAARAGYLDNLNGHTAQTGDSFALLGTPAGASVSADIAAVKAQTATIESDTTDIKTRLPAALISGRMSADMQGIGGSATAASKAGSVFDSLVTGQAQTGTLSTTQMTTNLTEATNDHYNGRLITFLTGTLAGQQTDITDYDGTTKALTFTALTEAPANGDAFVIT